MLLLSAELRSCCAAGTNGCLDLRRREFPLVEQAITEWSRCPGAMARLASPSQQAASRVRRVIRPVATGAFGGSAPQISFVTLIFLFRGKFVLKI